MRPAPAQSADATQPADSRVYILGGSESELRRLERQGAFLRDLTEDMLRRAGLAAGMRVLDIGCGVGDVSLLAAELVGPSGRVLGIDRSADALAIARRRAAAAARSWARFEAAELDDFSTDEAFDALIGRLILLYVRDPAATLRRLSPRVRPGGLVAFQEMAMPATRSVPDGTCFNRCKAWIIDTFLRGGFEPDMGGKLFAAFTAAGLPSPRMIAAARVEGGPQSGVYAYIADAVRSLLPMTERLGVAGAAEIDIDTLADRLRAEAIAHDAAIMTPPLIGAWARLPFDGEEGANAEL